MLQWFSQSFLWSVSYLQNLHLYFFPEVAVDEDVDGACWRWRDGAACFADMGGFDGCNGGGNCNETGIDICDDWDGWDGWEGLVWDGWAGLV